MSVDTVGVVVTACKDVRLISDLVQTVLEKLMHTEQPSSSDSTTASTPCAVRLNPNSGFLEFLFRFRGEQRRLSLAFDCDEDFQELGPQSLWVKLGAWGGSELIMQTVLQALSVLGPAYYDADDCDAVDLAPLTQPRPSLMNLVALGYFSASKVEDWVRGFKGGVVGGGQTFETFFGVEESWLRDRLNESDRHVAWAAIETRAHTQVPPLG